MSYDLNIAEETFNYTYNVRPMFVLAVRDGLYSIHDLSGHSALMKLRLIRSAMEDHYPAILELNPSNGWGDFDGALNLINQLILASLEHPDDNWSVT